MSPITRCKLCDEPSEGELCSYCKKHKKQRCRMCYCIIKVGTLCDYCNLHEQEMLDKCCCCGKTIKQSLKRFKRHGNWCGECLHELSQKTKGYDGAIPYDEWLELKQVSIKQPSGDNFPV